MKVSATLSILVVLLYTCKVLGEPVHDKSYHADPDHSSQADPDHNSHADHDDPHVDPFDADSYYPEHDAGHVAYQQALYAQQECLSKCTELSAPADENDLGVTVPPRLDMERCMHHCDELNPYR
ncbi:uncharacterized protein LOC127717554 isoform X2 [Mytilus californianus]|uniref:uncharacterized protein LOC127717554 isoform X2 n=1 Tax=Mytilus californianus TaxID=6549 RepID=UPI0022464F50|nr:uncharacterized protein LOC127717554 isoform X2 [Mytilus californianus]